MGVPSLSGMDILILVAPFLAMLGMAMVGLDERYANPRPKAGARRFFCEVDDQGRLFLSDPDGRLWLPISRRPIEGKFAGKR